MNYQQDFPLLFHDFKVRKLQDYEPMWVSSEFENQLAQNEHGLRSLDAFCYMIPDGECFEGLRFDQADTRTLRAERYGGGGIGRNGGGGRCGNIGPYQVKGIGRNPLVATAGEVWHSYGGLNAEDAIYEALIAQVLAQVLPSGVANIHAVVATGPGAAYLDNGKRGWGALMIREAALRPAHFLRAGRYAPVVRQDGMISDVARVRAVNKQWLKSFNNVNDLVHFLGGFLMKCASQFTFARIARLMHGSLTASNICFDGRWIDLTNTSFLPTGINPVGVTSFYDECHAPVLLLKENIDTLNKYNNLALRIEPLANYYYTQLNAYFTYHLRYFFALDYSSVPGSSIKNELEYLQQEVVVMLSSGTLVRDAWPDHLSDNDAALALLEFAFNALFKPPSPWKTDCPFQLKNAEKFLSAFREAFEATFAASGESSRHGFATAAFIAAYKRSALNAYYYKGRLSATIRSAMDGDSLGRARTLLDNSHDLSGWIFAGTDNGRVTLFRTAKLHIQYCAQSGTFLMAEVGGAAQAQSARTLQISLARYYHALNIEGFDFKIFLTRMLDNVIAFDANK